MNRAVKIKIVRPTTSILPPLGAACQERGRNKKPTFLAEASPMGYLADYRDSRYRLSPPRAIHRWISGLSPAARVLSDSRPIAPRPASHRSEAAMRWRLPYGGAGVDGPHPACRLTLACWSIPKPCGVGEGALPCEPEPAGLAPGRSAFGRREFKAWGVGCQQSF